jgi:hypothetical protein
MKTDISIPRLIFEATADLASKLDISLSELYTAALTAYLTAYESDALTAQLDMVYETEESTIDPGLSALQVLSIEDERW